MGGRVFAKQTQQYGGPSFSSAEDDEITVMMRAPTFSTVMTTAAPVDHGPNTARLSDVLPLYRPNANDVLPLARVAPPIYGPTPTPSFEAYGPPAVRDVNRREAIPSVYAPTFHAAPAAAPARGFSSGSALACAVVASMLGVILGFGLAKADNVVAMLRPIPAVRVAGVQSGASSTEAPLGNVSPPESAERVHVSVSARVAPTPTATPAPTVPKNAEDLERSFRVSP